MTKHLCTTAAPAVRRARWQAFALLALLGLSLPAFAAELSFAHYAPGAGEVRLQLDSGEPRTLRYRDFSAVQEFAAGERRIRATRADGSVLAEAVLALQRNDRYVVILAGNGSTAAPFEIRVSADHNHPFTQGMRSLQSANLAILVNPSTGRTAPMQFRDICADGRPRNISSEQYGYGAGRPDDPLFAGGGLSIGPPSDACSEALLHPIGSVQLDIVSLAGRAGDRQRRFGIGDGLNEPYQIVLVLQGREPIVEVIEADESIEGLWYPVGAPAGTGLQLAFDRDAPAGQRLAAFYFGYDAASLPTWKALSSSRTSGAGLRIVEFRGGNPAGSLAAIPFDEGSAFLFVHSCGDITLRHVSAFGDGGSLFPPAPRNSVRLRKLFPPGCRPAAKATKE